jgi:tight adherence protein C
MIELTIISVAALAAAAVFLGVYYVGERVQSELTPGQEEAGKKETEVAAERPYFWSLLIRRVRPFVPERMEADLTRKITQAGGLEGTTPAEVVLYAIVTTCVGLAVGLFIIAASEWPVWLVILVVAAGALFPFIWLRDQVKRRHLEILRDMPFHLDLLTLSVEAGLDFGAAVSRMVDKGKPGPMRQEFSVFLGEIRIGKTRADALESMSERVGMPALSAFLGALIQADKMGSGLGKTLRLQAEQLRVERSQRAEKQAGEAPVKMLIPLVMFIFPTIWIILAAPIVFDWIFRGVG